MGTKHGPDDWQRGIFHTNRNVYAAGDVHGDLDLFLQIVTEVAQVCDRRGQELEWTGGNAIVILLGDILDNARPGFEVDAVAADGEYRIFKAVYDLNRQARPQGGGIVHCFGNHDIMDVVPAYATAIESYTSPGALRWYKQRCAERHHITEAEASGRWTPGQMKQAFWQPGGHGHHLLLAESAYGVVRCGSWLFMHAGPTKENISSLRRALDHARCDRHREDQYRGMDWIDVANTVTRSILQADPGRKLSGCEVAVMKELFRDAGIYWSREFSSALEVHEGTCVRLQETLGMEELGLSHLIVGHTPQVDAAELQRSPGEHLWRFSKSLKETPERRKERIVYGAAPVPLLWDSPYTVFPGVNFDCVVTHDFAIVKADNSGSRAFDRRDIIQHILQHSSRTGEGRTKLQEYFAARRASCAWILPHPRGTSPLTCLRIIVATRSLPRPWLRDIVLN